MIDTLRLAKRMADTGSMSREAAEALADELNEGLKESAVTKADLSAALARTEVKLIGWQFGIALALFGALKLIH